MARFKKADPQQARLKVSVYGPPGSGKTFTTLLMAEGLAKVRGKRIAYVDTERGTDFYAQAVPERRVHPEAWDFDALYSRSLADITDAVRSLNPNEHGIVVLDSISHLWESAMDAYSGKKTRIDSIPMHAWGKIKKPYKDLVSFLIGSSFDVFILGRQKNVFEDDEAGEMHKVGVAMRAESETPYEPHLCLRLETKQNPDNSVESMPLCYVEKDRTGILGGRVLKWPNFQTIEPLLPLLGEVQAQPEDAEERAAKDAELIERGEDDRAKTKAEKSRALRLEFQELLFGSSGLNQLIEVGEAIKKQKRYILAEDHSALTEIYKSRRDRFVGEVPGSGMAS